MEINTYTAERLESDDLSQELSRPGFKYYDDDTVLTQRATNKFCRKEAFLAGVRCKILDIKENQWNKIVITIKGNNDNTSGDLPINNENFNQLLDWFGKTKKQIIGNEVIIESRYFPGNANTKPGFQLFLTKI